MEDGGQGDKEALGRMRQLLNMDHILTKEDFVRAFKAVVDFVIGMDQRHGKSLGEVANNLTKLADKIKSDNEVSLSDLKKGLDELFVGDRLTKMEERVLKALLKKFDEYQVGIDGRVSKIKNGKDGEQGPAGRDGSPDKPEEIRDKLESLQGDDRLDVSAIRGLDEYMAKNAKTPIVMGVGASGGGKIVKSYDLSDQLNGSTRIFSMPAFWRVISVHLSSFPNILRPTTDYTVDGGTMQITFTSQVPDNALATGQTLIVVYAEI